MGDPFLSVILPVSQQADHIGTVVEEYERSLGLLDRSRELLLVVNGPADETLVVCQQLAERHPSVRALHTETRGWGHAVRLGLRSSRGELVSYTNSARTSPQDLALLVLYAMVNPNVVVKANRRIRDSWQRRLGSLLYNLECRALFDLSCWDVNGTPKVFPRSFDRLMSLKRDDDLIDAEFAMTCRIKGYPMLEVPIFSTKRHGGRSTTNLGSAFKMYGGAVSMWRDMRRRGPLQRISAGR